MDGAKPKGWAFRSWGRDSDARSAVGPFADGPAARTGAASVMVSSEKGRGRLLVRGRARQTLFALPAQRLDQDGERGRGHGPRRPDQRQRRGGHGGRRRSPGRGTGREVEVEFDAGANDALEVTCLLGGWGRSTGRAWFDDVTLTRLSGRELGRPTVAIDGAKTGPPMSKYIYGQFIEHLGRCIYQGIWAEMLEDRKFFWAGRRGRIALAGGRGGGNGHDGQGQAVHGRPHAARRPQRQGAGRHRPGGPGPRREDGSTSGASSWPGTRAPRRSRSA